MAFGNIAKHLEVDFGENGGRKVFNKIEQVQAFYTQEVNSPWALYLASNLGGDVIARLQLVGRAITDFEASQPPALHAAFDALRDALLDAFTTRRGAPYMPTTASPDGKFLASVFTDRPGPVSHGAIAFLVNMTQSLPQTLEVTTGIFLGIAHREGIKPINARSYAKSYSEALAQASQNQQHLVAESEELIEDLRNQHVALAGRMKQFSIRSIRRSWRRNQALQKQAQEATSRLEALSETYKTQMGLQAPVDYWMKKSVRHGENSRNYRKILYWYAPGVVIFGALGLQHVAEAMKAMPAFGPATAAYGALGLLLTTVALWIGRILVRLFMSEHHLWRRRRDSNPRYPCGVCSFSKRVPSASRPRLR
jgi:hypothetical protein